MKSREEIKAWIVENCIDGLGSINLSRLNFSGKTVITTGMVADKIYQIEHKAREIHQGGHEAVYIENNYQKALGINNSFQRAIEINNKNQTILLPRKVVEFQINEEERVKLNNFLKEMRK